MWRTKQFWTTYFIYLIICIAIGIVLLFWIGAVAMGDDLGNEERAGMTAVPVFILNYILGFPLGLFLYDDSLEWASTIFSALLLQSVNCFIQLSLFFFLKRELKRILRPRPGSNKRE